MQPAAKLNFNLRRSLPPMEHQDYPASPTYVPTIRELPNEARPCAVDCRRLQRA